jgi:hypothetical protein
MLMKTEKYLVIVAGPYDGLVGKGVENICKQSETTMWDQCSNAVDNL